MENVELKFIHYILCKEMNSDLYTEKEGRRLQEQLDSTRLVEEVLKNGCINIIHRYEQYLSKEICNKIDAAYADHREKSNRLFQLVKEIGKYAKEKKLRFIEPKGIALAEMIYGSYYERQFNDIDFLVWKEDLREWGKLFTQLGFFHRHNGRIEDICEKMSKSNSEYFFETKFFKWYKKDRFLAIELKKATSAIGTELIKSFMENTQEIHVGSEKFTTFDTEHLFLHLCANVYNNFTAYESVVRKNLKLRDFYDIYQFERKGIIDWKRCRVLMEKYNLTQALAYIRREFFELFHVSIFEDMKLDICERENKYFWDRYTVMQKSEPDILAKRIENQYREINLAPGNKIEVFYDKIHVKVKKVQTEIILYISFKENDLQYIKERRWYFYFVEFLDKGRMKYGKSVLLYYKNEAFNYKVDQYDIHHVNFQTTANADIVGKRVNVKYENERIELKIKVNTVELGITEWHLFDVLSDICILEDYYKHDKYLRKPDEILEIVQGYEGE